MTEKVNRRNFVSIGACMPFFGLNGPKNKRRGKNEHSSDKKLYQGPLKIDRYVIDEVYCNPVVKTTHRKLCVKIYADGIDYVFRVVGSQDYLGEIVETKDGQIRVHVWKILRNTNARPVGALIAWFRDGIISDEAMSI